MGGNLWDWMVHLSVMEPRSRSHRSWMDGTLPMAFALIAAKSAEPLMVSSAVLPTERPELDELTLERVLEELETLCHQNMAQAIETQEGLGIEYDEDVVCDVCRSPEGEDGNEMVFCDKCNVCVHQVGGPCHSLPHRVTYAA